jgi:putative photosynthetic complex assembly protein
MSARRASETLPRTALLAVAALLAITLLAAAGGRLLGVAPDPAASPPMQGERLLQFHDLDDGSLQVVDAANARIIATLEPGTNGFMRGMMRGLARTRKLHGVGAEPPFLLAYGTDGHLVLVDPALDSRIPLGAFGLTNVAAFAALLEVPQT